MGEAIKIALDTLKAAFAEDSEYAWGWHCNLAVAFMDTEPEYGGRNLHRAANEGAATFMQRCFEIDIRQSPQWKTLFPESNGKQSNE